MPWIREIPEDEATGELARVYEALKADRGAVANIHRVHSLFPDALRTHMDMYKVLLYGEGNALSRADAELIATLVSAENSCDYCVAHHGDALAAQFGHLGDEVLSNDHLHWKLDARQRAMANLATKIAMAPHAVGEEDLDGLRAQGMDDRAILEVVLVASYFCFVNRIALSLGVTTNEAEREGFKY